MQLVIKPHPPRRRTSTRAAVAGVPNIRVVAPSGRLAELLAAAGAPVTVNSTVAIDALALGLPSVVIAST